MSEGLDKHELSVIERFRESHHTIARMFAAGMTPAMIRRNTGISMRRLTLMWNDPTFQELIEILRRRYNEKFDEAVDTYRDLSFGNMIESELQVQDHLAEARERGELVPLPHLLKITSDRADRLGYSKHHIVDHRHDFASALDRAIARSAKVIDGAVVAVLPAPPAQVSPQMQPAPSFSNALRRRQIA